MQLATANIRHNFFWNNFWQNLTLHCATLQNEWMGRFEFIFSMLRLCSRFQCWAASTSRKIIWALKYSYFSMEVNRKCLGSFLGIAICASSALFISVGNVIVKHLSHMDPFLFSCIRYGTIAMMASPVTMFKGKEMWKYQAFCYTVKWWKLFTEVQFIHSE